VKASSLSLVSVQVALKVISLLFFFTHKKEERRIFSTTTIRTTTTTTTTTTTNLFFKMLLRPALTTAPSVGCSSSCSTRRRRRTRTRRTKATKTTTQNSSNQQQRAKTESYSFFGLARAEFPENWDEPNKKINYADSPLDLFIMGWFMRKISMALGAPFDASNISYDAFIALCFLQMKGRDPDGQRQITMDVLTSLMPPGGEKVFQKLFPLNKFSLELNAKICQIVFAWMVGPMTVETTTENDLNEPIASKVQITKCRWLQESGCTGMCVNMCKTTTQDFFTDTFNMPLTIKPNFEDKSCAFYFGQTPPPIEKDEALLFGCNQSCSTGLNVGEENVPCHKLRKHESLSSS